MLKGLIIWTLFGAFIVGISAQTEVRKDGDGNLVFPPLPETCEYTVTEQLNQTPKSATFGNIATGVIHGIAPASFAEYVEGKYILEGFWGMHIKTSHIHELDAVMQWGLCSGYHGA